MFNSNAYAFPFSPTSSSPANNMVEDMHKIIPEEEFGGEILKASKLSKDLKYYVIIILILLTIVSTRIQSWMKNRSAFRLSILSFLWKLLLAALHIGGAFVMMNDDKLFSNSMDPKEAELKVETRALAGMYVALKLLESCGIILIALQKRRLYSYLYYYSVSTLFTWSSLYLSAQYVYPLIFMSLLFNGATYVFFMLQSITPCQNFVVRLFKRCLLFTQVAHMSMGVILCIRAMLSVSATNDAINPQMYLQNKIYWWNAQIGALLYIYYGFKLCKTYVHLYHNALRAGMSTFLTLFHIFAFVGIYRVWHHPNSLSVFLQALLLYACSGFGITVGAHRLWSHRSYSAKLPFRIFFMILNSMANQGSIYHWSRDHRVHHKYSEQEADPHNASLGFFYSHMGWLFLKKPEAVKRAGKEIDCSDLLTDSVVVFQKKYDPYWNQFICFLLPSLYAYILYGDFWLGFFVFGAFRWVLCLHATWTVNSVAHLWGERPYDPSISPAESLFTALVAVGEGWHNWHHLYPFDYATAEGGIFSHWNPSKLIIDTAAYFGLVWDRKRATQFWELAKARRKMELEKAANLMKKKMEDENDLKIRQNLISSLPAHCMKKSLIRSILNLARDLLICSVIAGLAIVIKDSPVGQFCSETSFINQLVNFILWTIYAVAQGTVVFGVWVLGYEASGGRFSDYRIVNHIIGLVLHSACMIPYRPRRANKERQRASLMRCLREDAFAILKIPSWTAWITGAMSALSVAALCLSFGYKYGWCQLFKWYGGPWFVLNLWIMLYHWLLENGPQDSDEIDMSGSTLEYFTREWLENMWGKATRGRKYPWTRFFDHLHHHLSLSHVIQAVDFNVPHYHAKEAFRRLGEILEEFGEIVDAKSKLCNAGCLKGYQKPSTIASVARTNNN